jgi:predicted PurR-regulated permease PerM
MANTGSALDRNRLAWWAVAAVLFAALAMVVYTYVGTFVLGLFVYYATRRIHRQVRERISPPSFAAVVSLLTISAPVLLLLGYTVIIGAEELAAVAPNALSYTAAFEPYMDVEWIQDPQQILGLITENPQQLMELGSADGIREVVDVFTTYLAVIVNVLVHLFVALAIGFYLLRDDQRVSQWFRSEFAEGGSATAAYLTAVDRNLESIYFGNILFAAANAVVGTVVYNVLNLAAPPGLGVPVPTLLGLLTGAGSLVPVVGMKIVWVPVALYLIVVAAVTDPSLLWFGILFAGVVFLLVDTVPEILLRPYISGRDLHVGLVLFAYIFGPLLFGWYGLFLGPLIIVLVVEFARIILPELVRGEPLTPEPSAPPPAELNPPEAHEPDVDDDVLPPESEVEEPDDEGAPTDDPDESPADDPRSDESPTD